MDKSLAMFWNSYLLLQSFRVKMHKSTFFKEKNGFERVFFYIYIYIIEV